MRRFSSFLTIVTGTAIITSAVLAFSADQMSMPMGDSSKATVATKSTIVTDTTKLKPQTTCPIQGDPINKNLYVDYKGKRIYVCCQGCIAEVKKDPEGAIKKLALLGQAPETIAPVKKSATKAAVKDTSKKSMDMSGSDMKGMDMSSDTSMKGMDHSKMK